MSVGLEYIYVCRHGFRSNWVDPNIKTGPTKMPRDPPLAAYGLDQAAQLATFLSTPEAVAPHPIPERVFSSPFYRCIQTAVPTDLALQKARGKGKGVMLEHGVMEWYSPTIPNTGLHPRPASPTTLSTLFPDQLDTSYDSTLFPSRRGELIRDLQDRADTFIEAWTGRVEEMGLKCVAVFGHAASVIALGRALTGDKYLEVSAGCTSCSLYRRKIPTATPSSSDTRPPIVENRSTASLGAASGLLELSRPKDTIPCGVGEWEPVWLGRADYLTNGVERDWSMKDCVIVNGEVINDEGDHLPHPPEDAIPVGLAPGMERYLRRGLPAKNTGIKEIDEAIAADKEKGLGSKM